MLSKMMPLLLSYVPRPWLIGMSQWVRPLLKLCYSGSRYTDPIDGAKFSKLLPYGYREKRPNALSPSTLSLERHRLLWLYLKSETDFFTSTHRVLHVAPEQAFYKRFQKMKNLDYTTTDLLSPLADIKADITNLPFEDNAFDIIFCNHVLEHIHDDKKAMCELYRVMKHGGWGVFQIPLDHDRDKTYEDISITTSKERETHFGQYDHVKIYGMDYFDKLKSVGFHVIASKFVNRLTSKQIQEYCLDRHEILPIVKKQYRDA